MYHFSDHLCGADEIIYATAEQRKQETVYAFKKEKYPDIIIPNRSVAWGIYFQPENSVQKKRLRQQVASYNAYVNSLEEIRLQPSPRTMICSMPSEVATHTSKCFACSWAKCSI